MDTEVRIEDVEKFIASAKADADALRDLTHSAVPVQENGTAPRDWVEAHYARHDQCRKKVEGHLSRAHEYLTAVSHRITKLGNDLTVLSTHEDRLHRDGPRAHFSEAEAKVAALYKRYQALEAQLKELVTYLNNVLREADPWRYPGGMPRRWPGLEPPSLLRETTTVLHAGSDPERELDALLEADRQRLGES